MPKRSISVVKFGGSIVSTPACVHWVEALSRWSKERLVYVVPGGGLIAEAIRKLQCHTGLDDTTAHELALVSMRQLGTIIQACSEGEFAWSNLSSIDKEENFNGIKLWAPDNHEFEFTHMPKDWSVSSDSISLWLAKRVDASELILLKAVAAPVLSPRRWSGLGYVDRHFELLLKSFPGQVRAISKPGEF